MSTQNDDLFEEILRLARALDEVDDERLGVHISFCDQREQIRPSDAGGGFGYEAGGADPYVAWIQGTRFKSSGATSTMALLEMKNQLLKTFEAAIERDQKKIAETEQRILEMKQKLEKTKTRTGL